MPGRSLWYARLALERLIFDELERAIDPKAAKSFRLIEQRARRDFGATVLRAAGWWAGARAGSRGGVRRMSSRCVEIFSK